MAKLNGLAAWLSGGGAFSLNKSAQGVMSAGLVSMADVCGVGRIKNIMAALTVIFVTSMFAGCSSTPKNAQPVAETKQLAAGTVLVYDFGSVKLHAYNTGDALGDQSYLLETKTALIGIEAPAWKPDFAEYANYIAGLGKPMSDILVSSHPGGNAAIYGNARVYATAKAKAAAESGSVKAITDGLTQALGPDFVGNFATVTNIINPGKITIGGLDFIITEDGDVYDIEIPAINCVYTHMMGSNVHNILSGVEHIDAIISQMKSYQDKGVYLILTGHYPPETVDKAAKKIAYLETAKKLIGASANADEFITAMKTAFPDYLGENYLEMSAGMIAFKK